MKYQYEIRNAAGRRCCAGNRPDFPRCAACSKVTSVVQKTPVVRKTPDEWTRHFTALLGASEPLRSMAAFRQSFYEMASTSRVAAISPATHDVYANPPDGYALALAARKENR